MQSRPVRPLLAAAARPRFGTRKPRRPACSPDAPSGYFTAYRSDKPDLAHPVELWPQFQRRPEYLALAEGYRHAYTHEDHQFALNAHKLMEVCEFLGGEPLPPDFARQILHLPKEQTLPQWLDAAAKWGHSDGYGSLLHETLRRIVAPLGDPVVAAAARADHLPPHRHPRV